VRTLHMPRLSHRNEKRIRNMPKNNYRYYNYRNNYRDRQVTQSTCSTTTWHSCGPGVSVTEVSLTGVSLTEVSLTEVSLTGVSLTRVSLTGVHLIHHPKKVRRESEIAPTPKSCERKKNS
jgi:uncharacterized protein YjbI with pentapeptide repeats